MTQNSWLTVDPVALLGLDRVMTPLEIEDFLAVLEKEVWFRILEEELPKQVSKSDYTYISEHIAPQHDLNLIVAYVKDHIPTFLIENEIERSVGAVKKDVVIGYLRNWPLEEAVTEAQKDEPDFEKIKKICWDFTSSLESSKPVSD